MQQGSLRLPALLALPEGRAANALRVWVRDQAVMAPTSVQLDELIRQLRQAQPAATVAFESPQYALRRYRDRLYFIGEQAVAPTRFEIAWNGRARWPLSSARP